MFQSIFIRPSENSIFTLLSLNFKIAPDTAVAHAAVPQAFVRPAPRSHTLTATCFLFFMAAKVTLH